MNDDELIPLHTYLHRRVQEMHDVTNVMIAEALGYEKPNVVAMILNGSMKLPIEKVPPLADVLELGRRGLLRRVMLAYAPEVWETIKAVLEVPITSEEEVNLFDFIRVRLGGEDVPLMSNPKFVSGLDQLLQAALDRHVKGLLPTGGKPQGRQSSKVGKVNAAMRKLLEQQAAERAALMLSLREDADNSSGG